MQSIGEIVAGLLLQMRQHFIFEADPMSSDDTRRADALAMDIESVMHRLELQGLKRAGREWTGPCPNCGGTDRFSINTLKRVFNCRSCGGTGGTIDLAMFVRGLTFPQALDWLCGPSVQISDAERRAREKAAEDNRRRNEATAARLRDRARNDAHQIWLAGRPAEGTAVRHYLTARGIRADLLPVLPAVIRYHPDLPYMVEVEGRWIEAYRGPAMLAAIQGADDRFIGVHRTWIDPDRPKGKALIRHPKTDDLMKVKKVLGQVKGGAIRLRQDRSAASVPVMVMGEGIETTLSALISGAPAGASYWAGVSLGNMAGQRKLGKGLMYAGIPDLADDAAFVPPSWVRRLIYIQDGDSEPKLTAAKLQSGLRRAAFHRPGLQAEIVHAGQGLDLNDVLLGENGNG